MPATIVLVMLEIFRVWPETKQPIDEDSELGEDRLALTLHAPLAIVTFVGRVIMTAAPIPNGLAVCIMNE